MIAKKERESESMAAPFNYLSKDTSFEGTLKTSTDIRVDGTFTGTLTTEGRLVVGETGNTTGQFAATEAIIAGTVNGLLLARSLLTLKGTARVEGEIFAEKLIVEEGAHFNGKCLMGQQAVKNALEKLHYTNQQHSLEEQTTQQPTTQKEP